MHGLQQNITGKHMLHEKDPSSRQFPVSSVLNWKLKHSPFSLFPIFIKFLGFLQRDFGLPLESLDFAVSFLWLLRSFPLSASAILNFQEYRSPCRRSLRAPHLLARFQCSAVAYALLINSFTMSTVRCPTLYFTFRKIAVFLGFPDSSMGKGRKRWKAGKGVCMTKKWRCIEGLHGAAGISVKFSAISQLPDKISVHFLTTSKFYRSQVSAISLKTCDSSADSYITLLPIFSYIQSVSSVRHVVGSLEPGQLSV